MKVGDYVRTKNGYIAKIEKEFGESYLCDDTVEYIYEPLPFIPKDKLNEMIIKSSPEIIDLIEVGDYVNGLPVYEDKDYIKFVHNWDGHAVDIKKILIENIVTKEQFLQMEYKVGE